MQKDIEKLEQNTSWEKEFEKVMGCIPECASGLYEDVGCPAHGYDAMKSVKFFRGVLSNREKEIAEEVEKMIVSDEELPEEYRIKGFLENHQRTAVIGNNIAIKKVLQILKH